MHRRNPPGFGLAAFPCPPAVNSNRCTDDRSRHPEIKTADVVLTPNPTPVEQRTSVDRIWGREVVFHQVRLIRQDLGEAAASVVPTAPALSQDAAIRAISDYGGFVKTNAEGRVSRISLVYDEDDQGNRRECAGTSDAIAQWFPAFPELEELWLFGS